MSFAFNSSDMFEMAEQMEKNGARFYRMASEGISESPNKALLLDLAKMEAEHEKMFASMKADMTDKEKEPTTFDPSNESAAYLRSLVETKVFFEKEIDVTSVKEILKDAITAEKDSIVFYLGMKDLVPDDRGKNRIDEIIKEEMGHIRLLGKKLTDLKS